ncbi:MAG TPA: glycoside hydrolase family 97 N-terminal domain-containing protein, partial [Planctomycetota bacterium]|nr:glycoside hydrolase family 97 N-terminal domain-containing protein [Planctomycetota bacterium]
MSRLLLVVFVLGTALQGFPAEPVAAQAIRSPDGRIAVSVDLSGGQPRWSVVAGQQTLIEHGLLGVETTPVNYSGRYTVIATTDATGDSTWHPVWGNRSTVRDQYRQMTMQLQESAGAKRLLNLIVRAYDEGVALRYEFPSQPGMSEVTVKNRLTEHRFTADHPIWQTRNYEYGSKTISTMTVMSESAVTLGVGNGRYVALTDADRANYSQVFWKRKADTPSTLIGQTSSSSGTLPFATSWEVVLIGDTLGKLYENRYLVDNLNPPCAITDTSWIRPGKAICQIRNGQMTTMDMRRLMDFASKQRFEYVEIDHSWNGAETKWTPQEIATFEQNKGPFWNAHPEWRQNILGNPMVAATGYVPFRPQSFTGGNLVDLDVPALTAYGKQLDPPVGLCVYVRSALFKEFGGEHAIDAVFAAYEKMGIAGVKPGFTPANNQADERTVAYMMQCAAKHHLIASIHDAYAPYGLSRTYPNLMNVEGGAGEEAEHSFPPDLTAVHDVMLTFTRCLMGPFDYTPEIGLKNLKTHCHQAAMLGVWEGRHSVRGGMRQWSPGGENSGGELEFISRLPSLFDETCVVAEANESVTVARRRGETWFIASMGGQNARSIAYPLDVLAKDRLYTATMYSDTPGSRVATRTQQAVT